jgi:hypothetical protein
MNSNFVSRSAMLLAALLSASCGGGGGSSSPAVSPTSTLVSIALSPLSVSLPPGGTQQLTVTGTYSDGSTQALTTGETFASTNTAVATVSAAGLVTVAGGAAIGATATISAADTASGKQTAAAQSTLVTVVAAGSGVPTATSVSAATATAQSNSLCTGIAPFYWEVGDKTGALASGSLGTDSTGAPVTGATKLSIASASKWMYGAYVAQLRGGAANLTANDITFLHFTSGYTNLQDEGGACAGASTVNQCLTFTNSSGIAFDVIDTANVGLYYYGGGHMENHANLTNSPLATVDVSQLGQQEAALLDPNIDILFTQPLLSGGILTNSDNYAIFLRDILSGALYMHDLLGTSTVCTQPSSCATAAFSPIPLPWQYSIGHWVETDNEGGDGTFSSPGAYGFYPWIDSTKTYYGIISRETGTESQEGYLSVQCGRLIRRAFVTGQEQ